MEIDQALRNFLTGVVRQRPPTVRATLGAARRAYGTWRAVAGAMGVSERTLRRIRAGLVSPRSRARIADLSRDPAVRRASVTSAAARRLSRMQTTDTRVAITAVQGPVGFGRQDYTRERTIDFTIPADIMVAIADAFFSGDDAEAVSLFRDAIMSEYGENRIGGIQDWEIDPDTAQIDMDV